MMIINSPSFNQICIFDRRLSESRFASHSRDMETRVNIFQKRRGKKVLQSFALREYSRAALFTIIVATDKPVAFPRRLIISRRKRKGLLRPGATLTSTPLSPSPAVYTPCTSPRTYFHGHQRRVIIGLHF